MLAVAALASAMQLSAQTGANASVPMTLPYSQTFDDESSMEDFTIVDANNDNTTWKYDEILNEAKCGYNFNKAMDDWLITRPVELKANNDYFFSVKVREYRASGRERFEVCVGTSPTPQGMTIDLIPPTEIYDDAYGKDYPATIRVPEDGIYYIGIHGISDKNQFSLIVDNISLKGGASDFAPASPTDFKVEANADGDLEATLTFTIPEVSVEGEPLSNIIAAHIYRDEVEVHSIDSPKPGDICSWTDKDVTPGEHIYEVAAEDENGIGAKAAFSVYVGLYPPAAPTAITLEETGNYGEARLTWKAPEKDRYGHAIDPARVTYRIVDSDNYKDIIKNLSATSYTFQAIGADERQEFKSYLVYASTNGGENNVPNQSNSVALGTPYPLPYAESFNTDEDFTATPLASETLSGAPQWYFYDDGDYALGLLRSQDGDNGYVGMYGVQNNFAGRLVTAKIDLTKAENPAISFYTYRMAPTDNNEVSVCVANPGGSFSTIRTFSVSELNGEGWVKVMVPLTRYKGRVIQVGFGGKVVTDAYIPFDNLRVFDMAEKDLSIGSVTAPATVRPNEEFTVKVKVDNNGSQDVEGAVVELYLDNRLIDSSEPFDLLSCEDHYVSFTGMLGALDGADHTLKVAVITDGDKNPDDNIKSDLPLTMIIEGYPVVSDLRGKDNGAEVTLNWTAPDPASYQAPEITDDFESYPMFAKENVGPWEFRDEDKGFVGEIGTGNMVLEFPGLDGQQSWWVMDASYSKIPEIGYVEFWEAHSGTKYLMQKYGTNEAITEYVPANDWIVSPELSGHAQTLSFWAKSYQKKYPESFKVYISGTDAEAESFIEIGDEDGISDKWTEFKYELPAGTRFFAIACVSEFGYSMFVDDITYTPAVKLTIEGFHVYRDGVRITTDPVSKAEAGESCTFTDTNVPDGSHSYVVTTLYDKGESEGSNLYNPEISGVTEIENGYAPCEFYTLQGVKVEKPTASGVYIRVCNGKATRIMVK